MPHFCYTISFSSILIFFTISITAYIYLWSFYTHWLQLRLTILRLMHSCHPEPCIYWSLDLTHCFLDTFSSVLICKSIFLGVLLQVTFFYDNKYGRWFEELTTTTYLVTRLKEQQDSEVVVLMNMINNSEKIQIYSNRKRHIRKSGGYQEQTSKFSLSG